MQVSDIGHRGIVKKIIPFTALKQFKQTNYNPLNELVSL